MSARSYTRRQLMMDCAIIKPPKGYIFATYIQSVNSNTYINTGIKAKASTKVDCNILLTQNGFGSIFGAASSAKPLFALELKYSSAESGRFLYGGTTSGGITALTTNNIHNIVVDKGKLYYDNVLKLSYSWGSYGDSTLNIMIFRTAEWATVNAGIRLYDFRIYENSSIVRDFRPVKRLSDNKYGLYDVVSKTVLFSAGSDNFTGA